MMTFRVDAIQVGMAVTLLGLAALGQHCLSSVYHEPPPAPTRDAGPDATLDASKPPPYDDSDTAMAETGVDCAAYPWCGLDFCPTEASIPLECYPPPDNSPWNLHAPPPKNPANYQ